MEKTMATSVTYAAVKTGTLTLTTPTGGYHQAPSIQALDDGTFVAAFLNNGRVTLRKFSADGVTLGPEIPITMGGSDTPLIERMQNGNLLLVWSDGGHVFERIFNTALIPLAGPIQVDSSVNPTGSISIAQLSDGNHAIAYTDNPSGYEKAILFQIMTPDAQKVGSATTIHALTGANELTAQITPSPTGFIVLASVNFSNPRNGYTLYDARFANSGALVTPVTAFENGRGSLGIEGLANGGFAVSFNDSPYVTDTGYMRLAIYGADGTLQSATSESTGGPQTSGRLETSSSGLTLINGANVTGQSVVAVVDSAMQTLISYQATGAAWVASAEWLDASRFLLAYSVDASDGSAAVTDFWQVERTTTGDGTAEVIWLDGLADRVHTYGGADVVFAGEGNNSVYLGDGNDAAAGGAGPDAIFGEAGDEWIYGVGGNDYLYGGGGQDVIFAGEGNDFVYGEDGDDYLFGETGNDALSGGAGIDRLYGNDGDDWIYGGDGIDALYGGTGNDALFGDAGDDFLQGESGNDTLTGGLGNDLFFFNGATEGADVITDFQTGDVVLLANYGFTSLADIKSHMTQSGSSVILSTAATSSVTFLNRSVDQFTVNDVLY